MAVDIGRVAYQKYVDSLVEKQCNCCNCDDYKWEDLKQSEQNAWRHAAVAVLQHIEMEKEQSEAGLIG
jgi:hypothetical protein